MSFPAISCDVTPVWSGVGVTGLFLGSINRMERSSCQTRQAELACRVCAGVAGLMPAQSM
jgi:hypothetical protein